MADEKDAITPGESKEPKPLSGEGSSIQMEIGTEPKVTNTKTNLGIRGKDFIKGIIDTPKEGPEEPITAPAGGGLPPKEPAKDVLARLGGDDGGSNSGGGGSTPPPTPEQSKDGAGMLIDGFNALFLFAVGIWSKDPDAKEYQVDTAEKTRLKTYLTSIMHNSGKSIPPLWMFLGLFILTYIPMMWKAWQHRKLVEEQRIKNNPSTTYINIEPKRKRRKRSGGNDDAEFFEAEVIK